ncbi:MAG: hypothetical protein WCD60_13490, partial [Pseudolabrys sp.]
VDLERDGPAITDHRLRQCFEVAAGGSSELGRNPHGSKKKTLVFASSKFAPACVRQEPFHVHAKATD